MNLQEAMLERHSVRSYKDQPISGEIKEKLMSFIEECNEESGLHMQLITDEPKAFANFLCHYGMFKGVKNYIALVGPDNKNLDELCGYFGEKVVLFAQMLGLNTCWVMTTYKKVMDVISVGPGEKLRLVIAIGYGENQGKLSRSKKMKQVSNVTSSSPEWFKNGVYAALLAPTAVNQQKFKLTLMEGTAGNLTKSKVIAEALKGPCSKIDLGIVKYHFELGAGAETFDWV
ncbi:MAG: nitroreductase [Firmicutes bacterium]|nr:nitroreductase [Bacillota bacterium]